MKLRVSELQFIPLASNDLCQMVMLGFFTWERLGPKRWYTKSYANNASQKQNWKTRL